MSKERLEYIERQCPKLLMGEELEWLIAYAKNQSERVQELEKLQSSSKMHLHSTIHNLRIKLEGSERENKRYHKAMLFVNEELTTVMEVENLTDDEKTACIENASREIQETLERDSNE